MASPQPPAVRLSVVIPAYREERTIGRLLGQITPALRGEYSIEVIVSDGGSTDRTLAIAREGADEVVENTSGRRQTIAEGRNLGAARAKGDIIIFLNADVTLADPAAFFGAVAAAFADGVTAAASGRVVVDPSEATAFDRVFHSGFNRWCALLAALGAGMGRGEFQAVTAGVFRQVGGYDETLAAAEDYDLFRRVARTRRIRFLSGVTVYESPRRYRSLGYPRVLYWWFVNALSVGIRGRSCSREWTAVR